ncbi:MAG: DUF4886 domain-containing protein [Eubacteriales bacterium]
MKILSIGNSFSQDATNLLEAVSGGEIFSRNLYMPGCSLETHAENIEKKPDVYEYQKGDEIIEKTSGYDALLREKWDYVTVQQGSAYSGVYETFEPYLTEVINFIKETSPSSKIVFHRTWAYENGSVNEDFPLYLCDSDVMLEKIIEASAIAAANHSLPTIPVGNAVQRARRLPEFDIAHGGMPITRDGFHLSLDYGRYLASLVWYGFFTGKNPEDLTFAPQGTDPGINAKLKKIAKEVL